MRAGVHRGATWLRVPSTSPPGTGSRRHTGRSPTVTHEACGRLGGGGRPGAAAVDELGHQPLVAREATSHVACVRIVTICEPTFCAGRAAPSLAGREQR